jgi:hypothetical protein
MGLIDTGVVEDTRFLNTLLILSRSILGGHKVMDTDSIESPNSYKVSMESFRAEIKEVLCDLNLLNISLPNYESYHLSTKQGTAGNPAMLDSI